MSCPMVPSMMTLRKRSRFCAIFSALLPPPLSRMSWLRSSPTSPRLFSDAMTALFVQTLGWRKA